MRKILLTCCLLLGIAAASHAQPGMKSPEERAKQMQAELKLTDDQTAKIVTIYKNMAVKRDSLRKAGAGRAGMGPYIQGMAMQIKAVLTDDQWATYQKEMQARRASMRSAGGGAGGN